MARRDRVLTSKRLVTASVVFGLFIVLDIVLFGVLILDSLSQRELEKVVLETRQNAEPVAEELEQKAKAQGSDDLFVVVSVAEETKTYIDSMLSQRQLVRSVEIRDREGTVVYQQSSRDDLPFDSRATRIDGNRPELSLLETEVPIGDMGVLVIGLKEDLVQERIGVLRRELTRQASLIGAFSLALLLVGFVAFLKLFLRARKLEEQAEEAERLAYVGTLASGLAHEIRSPLNSLSLNMQMLEEEVHEDQSGSQAKLLSITRSELRRLERLATDFLTYAKPRPMDLTEMPLVDLLKRVKHVLGAEVQQRQVELEIEDHSQGRKIRVDKSQVGQMLLNLAQNSLAALEETRDPLLRLVASVGGGKNGGTSGKPVIEVIDNGSGIPDKVRVKMFDLFYSNRKGGTGLGLAIVQRIASNHDAKIEIDTVPGAGTTVRVIFPE